MTHEEFSKKYDTYLRHAWAPNPDSPNYAKQKKREKEYNHQYYLENKNRILANRVDPRGRTSTETDRDYDESGSTLEERYSNDINSAREAYERGEMTADDYRQTLKVIGDTYKKRRNELAEIDARNQEANNERQRQANLQSINQRARDELEEQGLRKGRIDTRNRITSEAQILAAQKRTAATKEKNAKKAANRRYSSGAAQNERSKQVTRDIAKRNAATSDAISDARRKQTAYQNSFAGKASRAASRAATITNNISNSVKAASTKVSNAYENASSQINKASKAVNSILNKYFG